MDAKVRDVEKMPDGSIDVCLFNGSIRTSEQEYMAQLLRRKAKVLVAFGSCADEGCIPGLANMNNRRQIFETVYRTTPSTENPSGVEPQHETPMPEGTLHLPVFYDTVRTLDQTVPVDYYLPGCPPEADRIWDAIMAILEGKLPAAGLGDRREDDRVPRMPADAQREENQEVLPHVAESARRRDLPAGAGHLVLRARHAGRLRGPVSASQFALHRLLRAERGRPRPRRQPDDRLGLGDRLERPGRDRPHHPRGHSGPGRHVLSLQPGRKPTAAGEAEPDGGASDGRPRRKRKSSEMSTENRTMKRISIDPVTRLEGHGKIDIFLDDQGDVANAYLQIPELRGFEQFCVGRPAEDMPNLTARICGVCPEAHHMAATKALDAVFHVDPPPAAKKLRELFYSIFFTTDHTTHFYALGGPDFVVGPTAPAAERNILGVVEESRHGHRRQGAQDAPRRPRHDQADRRPGRPSQLGPARRRQPRHQRGATQRDRGPRTRGRRVRQVFAPTLRRRGAEKLRVRQADHRRRLRPQDLQHGHGRCPEPRQFLRRHDPRRRARRQGTRQVSRPRLPQYVAERVEPWSYLKFPYLKKIGWKGLVDGVDSGVYKATPLSRLNAADGMATPLAQAEYTKFYETLGGKPVHHTLATHWARLIELLYAAEHWVELSVDPQITSNEYRVLPTETPTEGVGCVEAPRGTLTHHYTTDDRGILTKVNLIVGTTNNNAAISMSVKKAAQSLIGRGRPATEGLLNMVEMAFRAYDPCFGCATHSLPGQMPLEVTVRDRAGRNHPAALAVRLVIGGR